MSLTRLARKAEEKSTLRAKDERKDINMEGRETAKIKEQQQQ